MMDVQSIPLLDGSGADFQDGSNAVTTIKGRYKIFFHGMRHVVDSGVLQVI